MIKIGVCDDEIAFRKTEIQTLSKVLKDGYEFLNYEIIEFDTGEELISYYMNQNLDFILLDIEMGSEHGFDIAEKLIHIRKDTRIIFVTSHENLVFESFICRPIGFVRKRIFEQEFKLIMNRIIKTLVADEKVIVLGESKEKYQFLLNEIQMIDKFKHDIIVSIQDRDIAIRDRLSRIEDRFHENNFVKVNRGCMVNMSFIYKNENGLITLLNGKKITISRNKVKEVNDKYKNFTCRVK